MNINMEKHYGPLENDVLNTVEQFWGFKIPQNYRNFILVYNGGVPEKTFFLFKGRENGSILTHFFGFTSKGDNILIVAKDMGKRYMNSMLPIADDACGNRILLSVKGPDRGKIYFWDHEMEADTDNGETPDYSNLTLVADSFDEFIQNLKSEDDLDA
ncbi:MAG: SMI1/KNR4 family protein [Alphaproteobacteria bacterium]